VFEAHLIRVCIGIMWGKGGCMAGKIISINKKGQKVKPATHTLSHRLLSYIGLGMAVLAFFAILYAVTNNTDIRSQAAKTRCTPKCKSGYHCKARVNKVTKEIVGYACRKDKPTSTPTPV
jgi:hypothetical protein